MKTQALNNTSSQQSLEIKQVK